MKGGVEGVLFIFIGTLIAIAVACGADRTYLICTVVLVAGGVAALLVTPKIDATPPDPPADSPEDEDPR